jgi:hypothetical protein
LVALCETNVSNLISQRLDTIYQIKPKRATILFLRLFAELNTPTIGSCITVSILTLNDNHTNFELAWFTRH